MLDRSRGEVRETGKWHEAILEGLAFEAVENVKARAALNDEQLARFRFGLGRADSSDARCDHRTMIPLHREIPALALPDTTGRMLSTWSFKQERPLVLVFAAENPALLGAFAMRHADYWAASAKMIGIVAGPEPEHLDLPFPVLVDRDGAATARYSDGNPAVLVTDAFAALEGRFDARNPDHDRILALLSALEMRCPECGAPEWPADEA